MSGLGRRATPSRAGYPVRVRSTLASQMEQPTLMPAKCFVRDLADGQEVDSIFVVRARNRRQKRNGEPFLKLQLGRRHGRGGGGRLGRRRRARPGLRRAASIVRVLGRYSVDERYGSRHHVRRMRAAVEGEYDLADLAEAPPIPYGQMAADLQSLVETMQRPHLRELLADRLIDTGAYHEAPAAKYYHQAYRHGLLEHCLSVAQGVSALAATFPGSTATSRSPARCCTTSARSRPTPRSTARSS